ncbi:exodeoxyribonuclease V subunit gamma [Enterobacteriaceae endosymbiont of Plateumaris braccata]|uniref:exodeoxyribonuclease V subunit gamma n=1 Tax=Enterobacteriaceae endosymbiont of Plateumaris braccata TaxID=2675793 RepID=UPI001456EC2A|nr:exodeoxyribonuclease V subunit gamma [Enterobacteriaceae endosymbiont of Plateumaris braccata]
MLNLSTKKFYPEEIFYLLGNNEISKKFSINHEDDLIYLRYWINDIGIKHGLNFHNFKNLSLPKDQYTWKFGLYRMLYGYAIDNNSGNWNGIIPYNGTFGVLGELLGKFTYFLFTLYKWKKQLKKKQLIQNWKKKIIQLYSEFFYSNIDSNKYMKYLFKNIILFIDNGINTNYKQKISINIIIKEFQILLEKKKKQFNYSFNKINFCNFGQLNYIAFKASFVIGMNSKYYPRYSYPVVFNLIKKYPKQNDKNNLDQEKYFFLELLMASKKKLYLSYIDTNNINYDRKYPSILITELLEYISNNYEIKKNKISNHIVNHIYHINQKKNIFTNFDFNDFNFLNKQNFFDIKLSILKMKKILLKNIINFWKDPLKGFFNQRLGVYLQELNQFQFSEIEPFSLDYLTKYQINTQILHSLILNKNINSIYYNYLNKGILPYGNYGKILWNNNKENIYKLLDNLKLCKYDNIIKYINLNISGITLYGKINLISYIEGFIKYEPKIIDIKSIISFWIEHLILCIIDIRQGEKFISKIIGFKNTKYVFNYIQPDIAIILLKKYIDGYICGLNNPIMLPMQNSWKWLYYCYNKKNQCINYDNFIQKKAKNIFFYLWNINSNFIGNYNNIYFNRLNYFFNEKNWLKTIKLIEKWLLPIIFYMK